MWRTEGPTTSVRFVSMSPDEPPAPRPLDVDGVRSVTVGTVLWVVALLALLPFRSRLEEAGNGWWLWTCLAGAGLGLLGIEYTRRRRDAIARVRAYRATHPDEDAEGSSAG